MARKNRITNIKEIRDSTVFLRDKTVLAVLQIAPIDFYRMSEGKKQKVMKKYKQWLESLDYPVQIVARTVNKDTEERAKILKNNVEHLIKQKAEYRDLLNLFKEFEEWFDDYLAKNSKKSTVYYLVIPYMNVEQPTMLDKLRKSKAKAKYDAGIELLNRRVERCVKKLSETGAKIHRLGTEQLENLYWSYFNIYNHKGKNGDSVYIGPDDWFRMWKDVLEEKE